MNVHSMLRSIAFAGICVLLTGMCAGGITTGAGPASEPIEVSIIAPQAAKTIPITALIGSTFMIRLPANHTTGYSWQLAAKPNPRVVQSAGSTYSESAGGRLGRSGVEQWTFKALAKGSTKLTLNYRRPFEKNVPPVRTQQFTIIVQ